MASNALRVNRLTQFGVAIVIKARRGLSQEALGDNYNSVSSLQVALNCCESCSRKITAS